MSTINQVEANRRNGKLSKGPKTAQGKTTSAKNARKHGLLSRDILLPHEDAKLFDDLAEGLRASLAPEGRLEIELVERMVALTWRLWRAGKAEKAIIAWHHFGVMGMNEVREKEAHEKEAAMDVPADDLEADEINDFDLPDLSPFDRSVQANDNARRMAKEEGLADAVSFGVAFRESEGSLANLSRYETSVERSFYKTLHELQRLQAGRKGQAVAVPVAVDMDVTGVPEPARAED